MRVSILVFVVTSPPWDDEHKEAEHFDCARCKLAEVSKTINVIFLKTTSLNHPWGDGESIYESAEG